MRHQSSDVARVPTMREGHPRFKTPFPLILERSKNLPRRTLRQQMNKM